MSYDKLKYISIKKDSVILTTIPNNISPPITDRWDYMGESNKPLDVKLYTLCKDMIEGNIQPLGSCPMNLKELVDREYDRFHREREEFSHLGDFTMYNQYRMTDMLNVYHNFNDKILNYRATRLFYDAFSEKLGIRNENDRNQDYEFFKDIDSKINNAFYDGLESSRVANLKHRTKSTLIELCQIAPKIGLSSKVDYFGDYDIYEVGIRETDESVWNAVVDKLKEIGTSEQFKDKFEFYVKKLTNYPPTYETIEGMDSALQSLCYRGNMIEKYAESLKEKDEIEEDIER